MTLPPSANCSVNWEKTSMRKSNMRTRTFRSLNITLCNNNQSPEQFIIRESTWIVNRDARGWMWILKVNKNTLRTPTEASKEVSVNTKHVRSITKYFSYLYICICKAIIGTNLRVQIHCQCKTDELRETVLRSGGIEYQTDCPPSNWDRFDIFISVQVNDS